MMLRSGVLKSVALLSVFLTMGCLPKTEISAAKVADYKMTSDRLLLLEHMTPVTDTQTALTATVRQSFNAQFPSLLKSCGLQPYLAGAPAANSSASNPATEPSAEEVQKTAAALIVQYQLDTVLKLRLKFVQYHQKFGVPGTAVRYAYEASLDGTSGKSFWKSTIELLPDNIQEGDVKASENPALIGTALANALFEQMKHDNLFVNCPG